jgi:hypothetical protein
MKNLIVIGVFLLLLSGESVSQQMLTGNLKEDSKIAFAETNNMIPQFTPQIKNKKSPILAGIMSLFIPGSGEIYSEEYLKAAVFLAVEAAVITTAIIYDNKGDDKTVEFEGYADREWNVVKYAEWLNEYIVDVDAGENLISINPDASLNPWERVNWDELNAAEKDFSHKLPPYGEQQYYELIGKYPQYSPGWREFDPADNDYHHVPPQFLFYADMRGTANDYYNVATKAVIGIYINHFLSALDAVWSAASYNKDIALNIRTGQIRYAGKTELVPYLNFSYRF